jgi:hypothetical protein
MDAMLNTKTIELENLVKEKTQIRLSLDTEIQKLKSELEARNILLKEESVQYEKDLNALEYAVKVKN